jgi:hypothetical protein
VSKLRQPTRFTRVSRVRFAKNRRDALAAQLGCEPSPAQEVLISRAVALEWRLREIDRRLTSETPIETLISAANSTEQQLRLTLCALGLTGYGRERTLTPHLLRRCVRPSGPIRGATRRRPALSGEPSRPAVTCRTRSPLPRPAKERDASRFTRGAGE